MRTKHTLWKVSNGYLLVPEDCDGLVAVREAPGCAVFKSLKEFSEWKPQRIRRKRNKLKHFTEQGHPIPVVEE
jgi:hypothetical protein